MLLTELQQRFFHVLAGFEICTIYKNRPKECNDPKNNRAIFLHRRKNEFVVKNEVYFTLKDILENNTVDMYNNIIEFRLSELIGIE